MKFSNEVRKLLENHTNTTENKKIFFSKMENENLRLRTLFISKNDLKNSIEKCLSNEELTINEFDYIVEYLILIGDLNIDFNKNINRNKGIYLPNINLYQFVKMDDILYEETKRNIEFALNSLLNHCSTKNTESFNNDLKTLSSLFELFYYQKQNEYND